MRDMLLDHAPHRGAGAGYDHNDYIDAMREPVELWAAHIANLIGGENVTVLR